MNRYQPGTTSRDGIEVYIIIDTLTGTWVADYWYSEEWRDSAMEYLNAHN